MIQDGTKWLRARLRSTPSRTFVLYPIVACGLSAVGHRGRPRFDLRFLPILIWGYLQYRLCGDYRQHLHAGSRGMENLPNHIIRSGPYGLTREVRRIAIAPDDRARFLELLAASAPAAVRG